MPSDYASITEENKLRRGTEFDDIGRFISEQFYTDKTHFIYELLQNAEDAIARRELSDTSISYPRSIRFSLHNDRLEVRHFGQPFNEDDVRGISDILHGTKSQDFGQIGKFGIGFKSVYAFTATPEVHSGDENFCVKRYIRPESTAPHKISEGETLFIIPFNHPNISNEEAFHQINTRLGDLGIRTLLFLRYIDEIVWEVNENRRGTYVRETSLIEKGYSRKIYLMGELNEEIEEENWIVFERSIPTNNGKGRTSVEVAYLVEREEKKERIKGINSSPLYVYFPTEKQTQLHFLIQGHYHTTPARDNISQDDKWNRDLIEKTAKLAAKSLISLRDKGFVDVGFLENLPIDSNNFPEEGLFSPFYDEIRNALRKNKLLPTNDGKFVRSEKAKLARTSELRNLLSYPDLPNIIESEDKYSWLTDEITEVRTPELRRYLMQKLNVEEINPEGFARNINSDFLEQCTDEWMIQFYSYLTNQNALWRKEDRYRRNEGILRNKAFIRLENGEHVVPFARDGRANVYIPPLDGDSDFPLVRRTIAENESARNFLINLGLTTPDIIDEVFRKILPKYSHQDNIDIGGDENIRDLAKIIGAYATATGERKKDLFGRISSTRFLNAINAEDNSARKFQVPRKIYIDDTDLRLFFMGNSDAWFLDYSYFKYRNELCSLGVNSKVKVNAKQPDAEGNVILEDYYAWHKRGLDGFDRDGEIIGLEFAVKNPEINRSIYVWNQLLIPYSRLIRGTVQESTHQTFDKIDKYYEEISEIGRLVIDNRWIPDKYGEFRKPSELSIDDLHEELIRNKQLAKKLGMVTSSLTQLAETEGVEEEELEMVLRAFKKSPKEILELVQELLEDEEINGEQETETPEMNITEELESVFTKEGEQEHVDVPRDPGIVIEPGIRRNRTLGEIIRELAKGDASKRFTRISKRKWEDKDNQVRVFLNEQYGGNCQICGNTFPKRDGQNYFEGLYLISHTKQSWIDRAGNVLCLCPTCCSKFLYGSVESENIIDQITNFKMISEGGTEEPILLINLCGDEVQIKYSEKHILDLQEMIKASSQL